MLAFDSHSKSRSLAAAGLGLEEEWVDRQLQLQSSFSFVIFKRMNHNESHTC